MDNYLGESIPKLGFGLMRLPRQDKEINVEEVSKMADMFLERGFRYFDTAWGYPGSEAAFGAAVAKRHSREEYLLATKCPAWMAHSREEARGMIQTSLERTGAGYFDFYLFHNLGEKRTAYFDKYGIWDYVLEQKAKGLIKHVGCSFHDKPEVLEGILKAHPELEFVQLQINYADWENPVVQSRGCYETARRYGKPVIIMEPVKGGTLASVPAPVAEIFRAAAPEASLPSWAIRFAASLPGVITVLSGMSSLEQVRDNTSYMQNFRPLDDKERKTMEQARKLLEAYRTIPCTACGYCMEVCPQGVSVPGIFEAANIYEMYNDMVFAKSKYMWNTKSKGLKRASDCLKCGKCEQACPQHIKIRCELERAAALFDKE